ncbi:hypothetical protein HDV03_004347 [Kappamyces sp. JEL0829]|nr:hypothetical protein HDV03_004347 [Kappamyces sp. JEL0829]
MKSRPSKLKDRDITFTADTPDFLKALKGQLDSQEHKLSDKQQQMQQDALADDDNGMDSGPMIELGKGVSMEQALDHLGGKAVAKDQDREKEADIEFKQRKPQPVAMIGSKRKGVGKKSQFSDLQPNSSHGSKKNKKLLSFDEE